MPSGAKNGQVSKDKRRKNLAMLAQFRDWNLFFSATFLSSNVKTVALTRAPKNVGETYDISFEAPFTLRLLAILTWYFSGVFVCNSRRSRTRIFPALILQTMVSWTNFTNDETNFTNDGVMKYVIGALQWQLPWAPLPFNPALTCSSNWTVPNYDWYTQTCCN